MPGLGRAGTVRWNRFSLAMFALRHLNPQTPTVSHDRWMRHGINPTEVLPSLVLKAVRRCP